MEHITRADVVLANLNGLILDSSKESIFISTPLAESIGCQSGEFRVDTENSFFAMGKAVHAGGIISLSVKGADASVRVDSDNGVFLNLTNKGIDCQGPGVQPAYIKIDGKALILGKGATLLPLVGGMIRLQDSSVVIQSGSTRISVTPSGVVIEAGATKFELCPLSGIKLTAGPVSSLDIGLADIEAKCAENTIQLNAIQAKIDAATVEVKAQVKAAIKGLLAEMQAHGILDQSAALLNL